MRRLAPFLVLVTLFAVLTPGLASAHTVERRTSIDARRDPGGVVAPGTRVRIFGQLNSFPALSAGARRCQKNSIVRLIEVGEGQIARDTTDRGGDFSFRRIAVSETTRFRVVFDGKILNAVHPHSHTCDGSSDALRVRVG